MSEIHHQYTKRFLVDPDNLRRLGEEALKAVRERSEHDYVLYAIEMEDGVTTTTQDVEAVLKNDNSKGRAIVSITINMIEPEDQTAPIGIITLSRKSIYPVEFRLTTGSVEWIRKVATELDNQIGRFTTGKRFFFLTNPWLDRFLSVLIFIASMLIASRLIFHLPVVPASVLIDSTKYGTDGLDIVMHATDYVVYNRGIFVWTASIAFLVLLAASESRLWSRIGLYFFAPVFHWGDEIKRQQVRSIWIWVIFVGFIINVAAGIFVTFIYSPN